MHCSEQGRNQVLTQVIPVLINKVRSVWDEEETVG